MPDILTMKFRKAGLQTLVQDGGRSGYQQQGVPEGGAMDQVSYRLANWLVGNPVDHPALEMTLLGPEVRFDVDCQIALTGADLSASINGQPVSLNQTLNCMQGDELSFGHVHGGCRAYLAIRGDWMVDYWLQSASALPGFDEILPDSQISDESALQIRLKHDIEPRAFDFIPVSSDSFRLRAVPGPDSGCILQEAVDDFFSRTFRVSTAANRMGYRLEGKLKGLGKRDELISSGVIPGTVQVASSGQPVIMQVDGQTTGGYYRVANIITADLPVLAQLKPGDNVSFQRLSIEEAECEKRTFYHKWGFLFEV